MTFEQTKEQFLLAYNSNGYLNMCESDDMHNAIVALEKQIPKKTNIHGYREGREVNTISFTCPICNKHIGRETFCKHCGQALDWSDTE